LCSASGIANALIELGHDVLLLDVYIGIKEVNDRLFNPYKFFIQCLSMQPHNHHD